MTLLFVGDVTIEMLPAGRDISARYCLPGFQTFIASIIVIVVRKPICSAPVCSAAHPRLCHIIQYLGGGGRLRWREKVEREGGERRWRK